MPDTQTCAATPFCPKGAVARMQQKTTILYCRLSVDDGNFDKESNSITNQRKLLVDYAERNGFKPYVCIAEACDIIEPNPGSLATSGFQGIWFILYYA